MLAVNRPRHDVHGDRDRQGPLRGARRGSPARPRTPCCAAATTAARGSGSRCPGGINASEGFPYIDPRHRPAVRHVALAPTLTRCGQPVIYSDDEGETWTEAAARPGCSPATLGDWPKIFAGPFNGRGAGRLPERRLRLQLHPEHPRRRVDRLLALGRRRRPLRVQRASCRRSTALCRAGDEQGGTGATIVHGSGRVLANGDVVVPLTVCGEPVVVRSSDEGRTWTAVATGDDSIGLEDILAGRRGAGARDHRPRLVGEPRRRRPRQPVLRLPRRRRRAPGGLARRRALLAAARLRVAAGHRHAIVVSVTARGRGEIALTLLRARRTRATRSARGA